MNRIAIYVKSINTCSIEEQKLHFENYLNNKDMNCDLYVEENNKKSKARENLFRKAVARNYTSVMVYSFETWSSNINDLITSIKTLNDLSIGFSCFKGNIILERENFGSEFEVLSAFAAFIMSKKEPTKQETFNFLTGLSSEQPRCDTREFNTDREVYPFCDLKI